MLNNINDSYIDGNGNVVIQNADNSTITINLSDTEQIRKFLIDFQKQLSNLPIEVLNALEKHNDLEKQIIVDANIYLTVLAEIADYGRNSVLLGITIKNLTKENRYFNQPYFKVSPKFVLEHGLEHDTFMLFSRENINYPVKLEYGQVRNLSYDINPNIFQLFKNNATEESFLQAFCGTTVGELYSSNEYKLDKLVKDYIAITNVRL